MAPNPNLNSGPDSASSRWRQRLPSAAFWLQSAACAVVAWTLWHGGLSTPAADANAAPGSVARLATDGPPSVPNAGADATAPSVKALLAPAPARAASQLQRVSAPSVESAQL